MPSSRLASVLKILIIRDIIGDYDHRNLLALAGSLNPPGALAGAGIVGWSSVMWRNYDRSLAKFIKGANPCAHSAGMVQSLEVFNPAV